MRLQAEDGGTLCEPLLGWGPRASREVAASATAERRDPWLSVAVPDPRAIDAALFVHVPGYLTRFVDDLSTDRRHDLVLERAAELVVAVRDAQAGTAIAAARIAISGEPCEVSPAGHRWIPGCDPSDAIYSGISDADGGVTLWLPAADLHSRAWCFDAVHEFYISAAMVEDRLHPTPNGTAQLNMLMPLVGAIRYVNGTVFSSRLRVPGGPNPSLVPPVIRRRVADCKRQLQEDEATVALAILPYEGAYRPAVPRVDAMVVLRRGGSRTDRMSLAPLIDYDGPQLVDCDERGPEIVTAKVKLEGPADLAFGFADAAALCVRISGSAKMVTREARLGDTVELPLGRYRLGFDSHWADAFAQQTYEVADASDQTFVVRWNDSAHLHVVNLFGVGAQPGLLAQLLVKRDGNGYILDAFVDGSGRAVFWSDYEIGSGQLYVRTFMDEPVTFTRGRMPRLAEADCVVDRVRPRR
ncbi:MAG: hypothetical protein KDE27_13295 [Planctomycetes bacterium]|nr:hypothetical protein [Planctomycetota bacterium]